MVPDLMASYKKEFLTTLQKREALGERAYRNACWWFGALAVERSDFLTAAEIRDSFHDMGVEGAEYVLGLFEARLRQNEQPQNQWREMIGPWLRTHWPRQERFRTVAVYTAAAEMLLETDEAFAEALHTLGDLHLVGPIAQDWVVLFRLAEAEGGNAIEAEGRRFAYASTFPHEVCRWLNRIMPPDLAAHEYRYMSTIIDAIQRALDGRPVPVCLGHLRERLR